MFKKIYVEITNACILNCPFCMHNRRKVENLSLDNFKIVIDKISSYTKYIYLHVLGEPLLNKDIKDMVDYAVNNGINVNLTTNGYLVNKVEVMNNLRQINISLHSYVENSNKSLYEYMSDIFSYVDKLDNSYISFRLWVNSPFCNEIMDILNKHYNTDYVLDENKSYTFKDKVFLDTRNEFEWPVDSKYYSEDGTCYALRDHIGILVNGDIVPCCLDGDGRIVLGNIYNDSLKDVINSRRFKNMLEGFKNNKKIEELCKKCHFIEK